MFNINALQAIAAYLTARFHPSDEGAAMVEYGLLLALIAVACVTAVTTLGGNVNNMFNTIAGKL